MTKNNLHPIFGEMLSRSDKERLLGHRGLVFWLSGLSGSGKSTLALRLERSLHEQGVVSRLLDGDNVRTGLCKGLGFSEEDRYENIRRIAEAARLFVETGIPVIASFVSPSESLRQLARDIIGPEQFRMIAVEADISTCINRDPKGLYKKALAGEIQQFTGINAPFEAVQRADLKINTGDLSIDEASQILFDFVKKEIFDGLST